mmetsp:Transcript_11411/g.27374  ORF Transcript_11411/g.27374 Transcript_11411/m.27374 type:complete len:181 (-) Transcript_11411:136-678(-)
MAVSTTMLVSADAKMVDDFGYLLPLYPSRQPGDVLAEDEMEMPSVDSSFEITFDFDGGGLKGLARRWSYSDLPEPNISNVEDSWRRNHSMSPRNSYKDRNLHADIPRGHAAAPGYWMHKRHELRMQEFMQEVQSNPRKIRRKVDYRREKAGMKDETRPQSVGAFKRATSGMSVILRQLRI